MRGNAMRKIEQINLNVTQETVWCTTGGNNIASIDVQGITSNSTWRCEFVYRNAVQAAPLTPSTAISLSEAAPSTGPIDVGGLLEIGIRVSTVAGSAVYGFVTFNLERDG